MAAERLDDDGPERLLDLMRARDRKGKLHST